MLGAAVLGLCCPGRSHCVIALPGENWARPTAHGPRPTPWGEAKGEFSSVAPPLPQPITSPHHHRRLSPAQRRFFFTHSPPSPSLDVATSAGSRADTDPPLSNRPRRSAPAFGFEFFVRRLQEERRWIGGSVIAVVGASARLFTTTSSPLRPPASQPASLAKRIRLSTIRRPPVLSFLALRHRDPKRPPADKRFLCRPVATPSVPGRRSRQALVNPLTRASRRSRILGPPCPSTPRLRRALPSSLPARAT